MVYSLNQAIQRFWEYKVALDTSSVFEYRLALQKYYLNIQKICVEMPMVVVNEDAILDPPRSMS